MNFIVDNYSNIMNQTNNELNKSQNIKNPQNKIPKFNENQKNSNIYGIFKVN